MNGMSLALRTRIKRPGRRLSESSYRVDQWMLSIIPWFFPLCLVIPSSFSIFGALTIPGIFVFLTALPTAREFWRKMTTGGYVPIASDLMVCLLALWMIVIMCIHQGPKGLVGSGSLAALEFAIAYFIARAFFGTPVGFAKLTLVMRVAILLMVMTALSDTVSGQNLLLNLGAKLSGGIIPEPFPHRFGMVRAQGSLEHPILLGIYFVISSIFIFYSPLRATAKILWIALCVFGAILPLSSAPLLSISISFGLIFSMRLLGTFPWRTIAIVLIGMFAVGVFFLFVDDPLEALINNLTLDPQTGLFRVLIWKWAFLNIERAPWLGIGFDDWLRSDDMPVSIDCLYLVQSIRYGLPALVLLVLTIFSTGITLPLRPLLRYPNPAIATLRFGMAVCIFVICFNAFTVHFWGADWLMLALVLGARAGLTESVYMSPFARADEEGGVAPRYPR